MNAADREIFEFDMSNFDWVEYVKRMTRGIRAFIDKTPWDAVKEGLAEYIELWSPYVPEDSSRTCIAGMRFL